MLHRFLGILMIATVLSLIATQAVPAAPTPDAAGRLPAFSYPVAQCGVVPPARAIPQMPGWPKTMGTHVNFKPAEGPATVDIDGDGNLEVFAASTDQKLYGWRYDGTPLAGFPKTLNGRMTTSPTLGDIDGDGAPEIVVVTSTGYAYALETNGTVMTGWPKTGLGNPAISSAVLTDLDGDGILEIIVCAGNTLNVWRANGSNFPGFPANFQSMYGTCSTPAVGDIDGDGHAEIVVEGWEYMTVFHSNGTIASGWPYHLPQSYNGFSYAAPVLVDFDGDGYREIAAGYHESGGGDWRGIACVWRYDGTVASGWPRAMEAYGWCYSTPAVGDIDEDGQLEFAMTSHDGNLYVFNADGTNVPPFPVQEGTYNGESSCAIADVDGDGHLEIMYGDNNNPGLYYAFERDGTITPGFPTVIQGAMAVSGSCVMDVDHNGHVNICAHDVSGNVNLWDLSAAYQANLTPFGRPHHDDQHTGLFDRRPPASVEPDLASLGWRLAPVRPNPTGGRIDLVVQVPRPSPIELTIVDAAGRVVARLANPSARDGELRWGCDLNSTRLGSRPLAAGGYFCRLRTPEGTLSRPFILLR